MTNTDGFRTPETIETIVLLCEPFRIECVCRSLGLVCPFPCNLLCSEDSTLVDVQLDTYDSERDWEAVKRIWLEIGWMREDSETERTRLETELSLGPARVARIDGETESLATGAEATLQYLESEVRLAAVTAVTTGNAARKRGLARRVTARLVADMAEGGAAVSMLGIFDQGYYDQLGFGTGSYDHRVALQPQDLLVAIPHQTPCRLTADDWEEMHACRSSRMKHHGYVTFSSPDATRCEALHSNRLGFGFRHELTGQLTHYLTCRTDNRADGPYHVDSMAYQNYGQFLALLGFLKSLEDQVRLVTLYEPPDIQLQDLVARPFARLATSSEGKFRTGIRSFATWQARICNLSACLEPIRLDGAPLRFNLHLSDPIGEHLDNNHSWRGVAGQYVVTLGPESAVESSVSADLPTLTASVGAFTRLWLGVRPASGLAVTDQLEGPAKLLAELDAVLRLPRPTWNWRF